MSSADKYIYRIKDFDFLDDEMIKNIHLLSDEEKMKIIVAFNDIIKYIVKYG